MRAPELIDAAIVGRALVYGSLPPGGRDLDLLVERREQEAIAASLAAAGYLHKQNEWARFACCSVEIVELTGTASWQLPPAELRALFDEARAIEGLRHVVRPSPHHSLLILARRVACGDGLLDEKLRTRLEQALLDDPNAWERARAIAEGWRAVAGVGALEGVWNTGHRVQMGKRNAARQERAGIAAKQKRSKYQSVYSLATQIPRPHRGHVIALSGLDGAGKSSQGAALQATLERLGYRASVVRTRIAWEDSLWSVVRPLRRVLNPPLRRFAALRTTKSPSRRPIAREHPIVGELVDPDAQSPPPDPVTAVRESSSLLTELWTLIITLANASSQWKLMRRHLLRGEIVISDRYTLDSIVELRYSYGGDRSLRAARIALSMLYPTPLRAYFLDVSPEHALERKGEWGVQWLEEHRDLYLEEYERLGVRLLDGERARADICAEIASEIWLSGI